MNWEIKEYGQVDDAAMKSKLKSCGDIHRGGYTGYVENCPDCRKANQQQDYATLEAECERLREVLAAARKFIPVAGPDGYSTALADAIARYDRDKEAKP